MACGKPVLISDKVNICEEIAAHGAGIVGEDSNAGVSDLLARFRSMPPDARAAMGGRARSCFLDNFLIDTLAESALSLLHGAEQMP